MAQILNVFNETTQGSPVTFTAPQDGLYLIISSGGAAGSCNIELPSGVTPFFEESAQIGGNRTYAYCITDLETDDQVVLSATNTDQWKSWQRTVYYLEDFIIDENTVKEASIKNSDNNATYYSYESENDKYLVFGSAYSKYDSSGYLANNTSGGNPSIKVEEAVGYHQLNGIYYAKGSNMPSIDFYGYDGGGAFVFVFRGVKAYKHPNKAGDILAIRDWFNGTRFNKSEVDNFFIQNNDYSPYSVTIEDISDAVVTLTGQTSGKSYVIQIPESGFITKLLFFTEGETIDVTDGDVIISRVLNDKRVMINLIPQALIPKMTSNTTPSGVCSSSSNLVYSGTTYYPYRAFNSSEGTWCNGYSWSGYGWIQYGFDTPKKIKKIEYNETNWNITNKLTIEVSNDNSNWTPVISSYVPTSSEHSNNKIIFTFDELLEYRYFRFKPECANGNCEITLIQLFGFN